MFFLCIKRRHRIGYVSHMLSRTLLRGFVSVALAIHSYFICYSHDCGSAIVALCIAHRARDTDRQENLLWQRDRATRLSVEILQLQNIPFEN